MRCRLAVLAAAILAATLAAACEHSTAPAVPAKCAHQFTDSTAGTFLGVPFWWRWRDKVCPPWTGAP